MSPAVAGVGLGLRAEWVADLLASEIELPFVEVLADNFLGGHPAALALLERVRERYPILLHCVGMNLGSIDPLDRTYLAAVRGLAERFEPEWVSDHLCWIGADGIYAHDLLPLPFNAEAVAHCAQRIESVQEQLGRRILIENVSRYVQLEDDEGPEWTFVTEILESADCGLLLDVNNIEVSGHNLGFDALDYLNALPLQRVQQLHLAGYEDWGGLYVDAHSRFVSERVVALLEQALARFGRPPALLEWDRDIPPLATLLEERTRLAAVYHGQNNR